MNVTRCHARRVGPGARLRFRSSHTPEWFASAVVVPAQAVRAGKRKRGPGRRPPPSAVEGITPRSVQVLRDRSDGRASGIQYEDFTGALNTGPNVSPTKLVQS